MTKTQITELEKIMFPKRATGYRSAQIYEKDGNVFLINSGGTFVVEFKRPEDIEYIKEHYKISPLPDFIWNAINLDYKSLKYPYTKQKMLEFYSFKDNYGKTIIDLKVEMLLDYLIDKRYLRSVLNLMRGREIYLAYTNSPLTPLRLYSYDGYQAHICPIKRANG